MFFMDLRIHFKFLMLTLETIVPVKMKDVQQNIGCSVYLCWTPELYGVYDILTILLWSTSAINVFSWLRRLHVELSSIKTVLVIVWSLERLHSYGNKICFLCHLSISTSVLMQSSLIAVGDIIMRYNSREAE